jgi:hypothetical protein
VHAALELETAVDPLPGDLDDDFLHAAQPGRVVRQDLGLPPMPLGVRLYIRYSSCAKSPASSPPVPARISSRTFFSSFGILREQQRLELVLEAADLLVQLALLLPGELAHPLVLGLADERFGLFELLHVRPNSRYFATTGSSSE